MGTILNGIKHKLSEARTLCPGMSPDMYILTDYMALHSNDQLFPSGLLITMLKAQNDIAFSKFLSGSIAARRKSIDKQFENFPLVVDAIADETFANAFRNEWKKMFGTDPIEKAIL